MPPWGPVSSASTSPGAAQRGGRPRRRRGTWRPDWVQTISVSGVSAASSWTSARPRSVQSIRSGKSTSRSDRSGVSLSNTRAKPQTAAPTIRRSGADGSLIGGIVLARPAAPRSLRSTAASVGGPRLSARGGNIAMRRAARSIGSSPSSATSTAISPTSAVSFEAAPGTAVAVGERGRIELPDPVSAAARAVRGNRDCRSDRSTISVIGRGASPASGRLSGIGGRRRGRGARPQKTELGQGPTAHRGGAGSIKPGDRQLDSPILAGAERRTACASRSGAAPPFGRAAEHQVPQRVRVRLDRDQQTAWSQQIAQRGERLCIEPQTGTGMRRKDHDRSGPLPRGSVPSLGAQHATLAPGVAETTGPSRATCSASVAAAT